MAHRRPWAASGAPIHSSLVKLFQIGRTRGNRSAAVAPWPSPRACPRQLDSRPGGFSTVSLRCRVTSVHRLTAANDLDDQLHGRATGSMSNGHGLSPPPPLAPPPASVSLCRREPSRGRGVVMKEAGGGRPPASLRSSPSPPHTAVSKAASRRRGGQAVRWKGIVTKYASALACSPGSTPGRSARPHSAPTVRKPGY
jgi:hypothetical protein